MASTQPKPTAELHDGEEIRPEEIDHGSRPMPEFVKKGLMRVQGGQIYLKAPYRVLWFREDHPDWTIETHLVTCTLEYALARCEVRDDTGRLLATGHKQQTAKAFPAGHIEKAETGAIARALSVLGYGTQCGEFDEDEVSDSPVGPGSRMQGQNNRQSRPQTGKPSENDLLPCSAEQQKAIQNICDHNRWDADTTAQQWYQLPVNELTQAQARDMIGRLNKLVKTTAAQN